MSAGRSNLTNLAAVAEIVAAVAVVLSLLYVGTEVRQNTKAVEGTTYQELVRASNEYLLTVAADSALAEILVRAWTDPSQLTDAEKLRSFFYERVFWRNMENAYLQHGRGILGEQEWEVYSRIACNGKTDRTWGLHVPALGAAFTEFIENCPD